MLRSDLTLLTKLNWELGSYPSCQRPNPELGLYISVSPSQPRLFLLINLLR
jgi:hypothetical protein